MVQQWSGRSTPCRSMKISTEISMPRPGYFTLRYSESAPITQAGKRPDSLPVVGSGKSGLPGHCSGTANSSVPISDHQSDSNPRQRFAAFIRLSAAVVCVSLLWGKPGRSRRSRERLIGKLYSKPFSHNKPSAAIVVASLIPPSRIMRSTPTARNPVTRGLAPVRARVNLVLITAERPDVGAQCLN